MTDTKKAIEPAKPTAPPVETPRKLSQEMTDKEIEDYVAQLSSISSCRFCRK